MFAIVSRTVLITRTKRFAVMSVNSTVGSMGCAYRRRICAMAGITAATRLTKALSFVIIARRARMLAGLVSFKTIFLKLVINTFSVTGNHLLIILVVLFGILIASGACYYYRRKPSLLPDALSDSGGRLLAPKPVDSASLQTPRTQETGLRMSVFNGSSSSSYDRSHITGLLFNFFF